MGKPGGEPKPGFPSRPPVATARPHASGSRAKREDSPLFRIVRSGRDLRSNFGLGQAKTPDAVCVWGREVWPREPETSGTMPQPVLSAGPRLGNAGAFLVQANS